MSFHCELRPLKVRYCECGNVAVCAATVKVDNSAVGTMHLCEPCKSLKPWLRMKPPLREKSRDRHAEFGRANSDSRSLTQSSIPNWGGKIKARQ